MTDWKPKLKPDVDLVELPLTPEEAFVALRLNGASDTHVLSLVTGVSEERVTAALEKLVSLGVVHPEAAAPSAPPAEAAAAAPPETFEPDITEPDARVPEEEPDISEPEPEAGAEEDAAGTHRKLFETTLRQLTADERAVMARTAVEPELSALCYDPLPAVIHELLDNPQFGLVQARLVATHHRMAPGLEAVAARGAFAADAGVRRALLRNPQLSAGLMRRLYGNRRLMEQYQLTTSRDLPEHTRRTARELMRARFQSAEADERVEVILKTEGRCLQSLAGLPVDGKTASRLSSRTYSSTLLVQNIARWAAAPPMLISHLLKQDLVRRSPQLRMALQRHPNAPSGPGQR